MLTKQDIDVLIDAVEAWEKGDSGGEIISSLMTGMFCRTDDDRREAERRQLPGKLKAESEKKMRKERGVTLRAKLIAIRDSLDADELFDNITATAKSR